MGYTQEERELREIIIPIITLYLDYSIFTILNLNTNDEMVL
jgi:hypothetical protein